MLFLLKWAIEFSLHILFDTWPAFAAVKVQRTILIAIMLVYILHAMLKLQFFVVILIS